MSELRYVDPRDLRPPASRPAADPIKLARQFKRFGSSIEGMPPIVVMEASDGVLVVYNGMTRATRVAKLAPGTLVPVEVIGGLRKAHRGDPSIGDQLA